MDGDRLSNRAGATAATRILFVDHREEVVAVTIMKRVFIVIATALAIMLFLSLMLVLFASIASPSKVNTAQSDIFNLAVGIKGAYAKTPSETKEGLYYHLTEADILGRGIPYANMMKDGSLYSGWGQVHIFRIGANMMDEAPYDFFVISYENIPSSACAKLTPGLFQNFKGIYIGGTARPSKLKNTRALSLEDSLKKCQANQSVYMDIAIE